MNKFRILLAFSSLLVLAACSGEEETACFDDRSCSPGERCVGSTSNSAGVCGPCDATEIPYDGVDNDCNPGTRDIDLDGDGDNAIDSAVSPGGDCNDDDDEIASTIEEKCDDGKDNDCDEVIDEPDCEDERPPSLTIRAPVEGALAFGDLNVVVDAMDDRGVTTLRLYGNEVLIREIPQDPPEANTTFDVTIDTLAQGLVDGPIALRAEVVDVAERTSSETVNISLDNASGPAITTVAPTEGATYGGRMFVDVSAQDPSGVVSLIIDLDGVVVYSSTTTTSSAAFEIDTFTMDDGTSAMTFIARDARDNESTTVINFSVDNTAPTVQFLSPSPNDTLTGDYSLIVEATDNLGVAVIEAAEERIEGAERLDQMAPSTRFPNGNQTLTATASDFAIVDGVAGGNKAYDTVNVRIDNLEEGPVIQIDPSDGFAVFARTDITAFVTSETTPPTPISTVEIRVDGELLNNLTAGPWTASYDFTDKAGISVIEVTATDDAFRTTTATVGVSITQPPAFRLAGWKTFKEDNFDGNGHNGAGFGAGDLDGDNVVDAVMSANDGVWLINGVITNGDWSAGDRTQISTMRASELELKDADGDGDLDIYGLRDDSLLLLDNRGANSFIETVIPLGTVGLSYFAVGDLDGDNDLDAIAAGPTGLDFYVLTADTVLTYTLGTSYGLNANVTQLRLEDVDNDGDLDALIGRAGVADLVTVYRNSGTGVFGAGIDTTAVDEARHLASGDMNGDGWPDLVIENSLTLGSAISVHLGNSQTPGVFAQVSTLNTHGRLGWVELLDIDGDNDLDVFVTNPANSLVMVLANDGSGGLSVENTWNMGRGFDFHKLIDLDGDGDRDLIGCARTDGAVAYAENLGLGDFFAAPAITVLSLSADGVGAGDFSGDGIPDIAAALGQGGVQLFTNQNGVRFREQDPASIGIIAEQIAVGDVDGMGGIDLAVGNFGSGAVILNNGLGVFAAPQPLMGLAQATDVAIGDADNDGTNEILAVTGNSGTVGGVYIQAIVGGAPVIEESFNFGRGSVSVTIGNVGSDADLDFAVANTTSSDFSVGEWMGTTWSVTNYNALPGITDVAIGKVGNDVINDILAVSPAGLIIMEGDPAFGFSAPLLYPGGVAPRKLVSADFNRDGLNDFVVVNSNNRASLLAARPQGGFFPPTFFAVGANPVDIVAADFDGDGRDDLAIISAAAPIVTVVYANADSL